MPTEPERSANQYLYEYQTKLCLFFFRVLADIQIAVSHIIFHSMKEKKSENQKGFLKNQTGVVGGSRHVCIYW